MEPDRIELYPPTQSAYAECGNCRYFWLDRNLAGEGDDGECRRFPPNWKLDADTPDESFHFPLVPRILWCGEYAERHNVELSGHQRPAQE